MLPLYTIGLRLYKFSARIAALFDEKAKQWIEGQKNWKSDLKRAHLGDEPIWFHCASVGEFEQARPVIEKLKSNNPQQPIALSFFSPSGYLLWKDYEYADIITYLPLDLPRNAKEFVEILNPKLAVFIKYEVWFNLLQTLDRMNIESCLVSAYFQEGHILLNPLAKAFGKRLELFSVIFAQTSDTKSRLENLGLRNVVVNGDTRFDRVLTVTNTPFSDVLITSFLDGENALVIGSNWPEDDQILIPFLLKHPKVKAIVVPHELGEVQLRKWKDAFGSHCIVYSEARERITKDFQILYVDRMGMLSKLYRFAKVAYIGGGFGKSVHNTLEAAAYGKPVVFGPRNMRFDEVQVLKSIGAGFEVNNAQDLESTLSNLLQDSDRLKSVQSDIEAYFKSQKGGSERVVKWIEERLGNENK